MVRTDACLLLRSVVLIAASLLLPASAASQVNQGLQLDTGRYLQISCDRGIDVPIFTAECWITIRSGGVVVSRDISERWRSDWYLLCDWSRRRIGFCTQLQSPDTCFFAADGCVQADTWYHLALVANGTVGSVRLYIDGALAMAATYPPRAFNSGTGLTWGGYDENLKGAYLDGRLDEARYWTRERSQSEIQSAMNAPLRPDDGLGLAGYWRFCGDFSDCSGCWRNGHPKGDVSIVDLPDLPLFACRWPEPLVPAVIADRSPVLCPGDSVVLTTDRLYGCYRWSTGDTTRSIVVHGAGTYTVTVIDSLWNSATAQPVVVTVRSAPKPRIVPEGPLKLCSGTTLGLTVRDPYATYRWSNGETTEAIVVSRGGSYAVEVTDSGGCRGLSDSVLVVEVIGRTPRIKALGPTSFCEGDSVILEADSGFVSYRWTTPSGVIADARSITARLAGAYMVTTVDRLGCTVVSTPLTVPEHPRPPAPIITVRCLQLRSTPAAAWQWLRDGVEIPGATDSLYLADDTGSYSVRITDTDGCTALSGELHIASLIGATAVVTLPRLEAAPGDRVFVPLGLAGVSEPTLCGSGGFRTVIRLDASILLPSGSTEHGVLDGRDRLITIARPWAPSRDSLAVLEFTAALGITDSTPLHFESFAWDSPLAAATLIDGEFRLRTCREGGARLFDGSGRLALRPNSPNPFNAQTMIEFELLEAAPARLAVVDALGRVIAVLFDGPAEPGPRRLVFDASALPSGVYRLLLSTPSGARSRSMVIIK